MVEELKKIDPIRNAFSAGLVTGCASFLGQELSNSLTPLSYKQTPEMLISSTALCAVIGGTLGALSALLHNHRVDEKISFAQKLKKDLEANQQKTASVS